MDADQGLVSGFQLNFHDAPPGPVVVEQHVDPVAGAERVLDFSYRRRVEPHER
jgi:hypothetical protein